MDHDRVIAALARAQHGLVTLRQLRDAGVSDQVVQTRLELGVLERVHTRTFRIAGSPRTWEQRVLAGCLSAGPDAAASHRAAARVWDLVRCGDDIDLTMPRRRAVELPGIVTHRSGDLVPGDVVTRRGIPVTKPARTLVDLGAVAPRRVVDEAIDTALARRLVTLDGLWQILVRVAKKGRNGCGVLRESLEWRFGVPESVLEGLFMRLVRDFDLPEPVIQFRVVVAGRERRLDAAYGDRLLAVELDGAQHRMSPEALADDNERQNDLVDAGWTILRFGFTDLTANRQRSARLVRDTHRRLSPRLLEQVLSPAD